MAIPGAVIELVVIIGAIIVVALETLLAAVPAILKYMKRIAAIQHPHKQHAEMDIIIKTTIEKPAVPRMVGLRLKSDTPETAPSCWNLCEPASIIAILYLFVL